MFEITFVKRKNDKKKNVTLPSNVTDIFMLKLNILIMTCTY